MTSTARRHAYYTEGTSALEPETPVLVLIEGGAHTANGTNSAPRRHQQATHEAEAQFKFAMTLAIAAVFVVFAIGSFVSNALIAERAAAALDQIPSQTVVVSSGDSLWSLAQSHAVEGYTTSELVDWIQEKNGLETATIQPGQKLLVPSAR